MKKIVLVALLSITGLVVVAVAVLSMFASHVDKQATHSELAETSEQRVPPESATA